MADSFVKEWTTCSMSGYGFDTCSYTITAVKVNASTVQLKGKTSGETVTITFSANGDETYSSSNPAHAAGTYYANPVSCPNSTPAWFYTFLSDNSKAIPLVKKSVQPMVPKKPPLKLWPRMY